MLNWLKNLFKGSRNVSSSPQKPHHRSSTQHRPKAKTVETLKSRPLRRTQARAVSLPAAWVTPGQSITVGDYVIPGGMLYVGARLQVLEPDSGRDPCLIDSELPVDRANPDYTGLTMGYWPSYRDISPACRAAYLEWLANGRNDPDTYIGYVFLFFYGLERRVFRDLLNLTTDTSSELTDICSEVKRLLSRYGSNSSFNGYASDFLDICRLLRPHQNFYEADPPLERQGYGVPINVQVALGQLVASQQPIPVQWLYAWYIHSDQARLRTPANRCRELFIQLLHIRYQQKYGDGIRLKSGKRKVKISYRPASSAFRGRSPSIDIGDLPAVTKRTAPLNQLQDLIDDCTNALDPYSRWLGRNSDQPDSLTALALLPPELAAAADTREISALRQWLTEALKEQTHALISGADLLNYWSSTKTTKLTKKASLMLAQCLEKLGYGIEPDVRFGGKCYQANGQVVLFKQRGNFTSTPSPGYKAATVLLQLTAMVVKADDVVDAAEQQHLEEHIQGVLQLSEAERSRLRAHWLWLLHQKPNTRGLKAKLSDMTSDDKASIANFLINVAGADGYISPQEISTLTKIYSLLELEADEIYGHIHAFKAATAPAQSPVTVRPAVSQPQGFTIPAPPLASDSDKPQAEQTLDFVLDLQAVKHKQGEAAKVAALLDNIFAEEETTEASSPYPSAHIEDGIAGLDSAHSKLLRLMAHQSEWNRETLTAQASDWGLLLDGALEVINDAAFDICDEALTDGDDPIEIDTDVLTQMLS